MTALQKVNLGTPPKADDGDPVRTATVKANSNVDVLNAQATLTSAAQSVTAPQALTAAAHLGRRVNIVLAAAGVVQLPAAATCVGDGVMLLRNLGTTVVTLGITAGSGDSIALSRLNPGETALMDTDGIHTWTVLTRGRAGGDNEVVNGNSSVGGNLSVAGTGAFTGAITIAGKTPWDNGNLPSPASLTRTGTAGATSFRNKIANPSGTINQRAYVSGAVTSAANQYTLDGWFVVASGQSLGYAATGNAFTLTAPAGGIGTVIAAEDMEGGTYTLSWGGTATATVNGAAVANSGQVALTANTQANIRFFSGTVLLPQLELGTIGTTCEVLPRPLALDRCRYTLQVISSDGVANVPFCSAMAYSTTSAQGTITLIRPMRAQPVFSAASGALQLRYATTATTPITTGFQATPTGTYKVLVLGTCAAGLNPAQATEFLLDATGTSKLIFSAEIAPT